MMNKKAGFEMSVTTLVVIVIAIVLLILGLVFVKQIFGTATKSVSQVDLQVRNQLQKMFGEEGRDIIVYSKEVNIRPTGESISIAFAARNPAGGSVSNLKYKVSLIEGRDDCIAKNGRTAVESWFIIPKALDTPQSFNSYETDIAYGDIVVSIPKGTLLCSQRVSVKLMYSQGEIADAFTINVIRSGLF